MKRGTTENHSADTSNKITRLDLLKTQLNKLTPKQLSELRGAIDAKLNVQPNVVISDEESAFIRSLF
ncbi:hypothetical protein [Vibrio rhodolitus]|uniref:hypothetical protein n=1 Tax=Vibrio rhodolitus TaxID=2231649 RepID=UPI000E0C8E88|nr:hypothetical protein [Vibrio rhodolitus]